MIDLVWTSENCAHIMEQLASAKYPPPIEKSNAMSHSGNAMPGPTNGHTGPTVSRDKTYRILGVSGGIEPCWGDYHYPLLHNQSIPQWCAQYISSKSNVPFGVFIPIFFASV